LKVPFRHLVVLGLNIEEITETSIVTSTEEEEDKDVAINRHFNNERKVHVDQDRGNCDQSTDVHVFRVDKDLEGVCSFGN